MVAHLYLLGIAFPGTGHFSENDRFRKVCNVIEIENYTYILLWLIKPETFYIVAEGNQCLCFCPKYYILKVLCWIDGTVCKWGRFRVFTEACLADSA